MKIPKDGHILAVVGSRSIDDAEFVFDGIKQTIKKHPRISGLVSGGAEGPDTLSQRFAKEKGMSILIIYPKWNQLGRGAGFSRNWEIVNFCDVLIAFWDSCSKGTQHTSKIAESAKNILQIFHYPF